jgi:23S rRNA G2069 N7-methylase RlmK/C1962 C5-methylase RlmI
MTSHFSETGLRADPEVKTASQAIMLQNRIQKRFRHLKKWAKRIGTDVFRLYDRDIPEIPLVLDYYGNGVSGALYQRPYEKDEAEERRWLDAMTEAIAASLGIPLNHVFLKQRKRQRGAAQYSKLLDSHFIQDVHEGGLIFRVNLSDYLDTGLFPDRRKMRDLIAREAAGKKVLNLFCYTASFSVYAAAGGAAEVDSVDLSNTYLDWAAVNFALNHLEVCKIPLQPRVGRLPPYRLIRGDVRSFLTQGAREKRLWDIIVLDPPSFSNSKKMIGTLDLRRDYKQLLTQCLSLLNKGGTLWFSANVTNFSLNPAEFPDLPITDMQAQILDEDFKGKKIPSCYRIAPGDSFFNALALSREKDA